MFGNDNREAMQVLEAEVKKLRESNKGSAQLAEVRARCAGLEAELGRLRADLASAQASTKRARERQKNSVERANRLKKQLLSKTSGQE